MPVNDLISAPAILFGIGLLAIVVPIVILRWVLRVDEMVKYQKETAEALSRIESRLSSAPPVNLTPNAGRSLSDNNPKGCVESPRSEAVCQPLAATGDWSIALIAIVVLGLVLGAIYLFGNESLETPR